MLKHYTPPSPDLLPGRPQAILVCETRPAGITIRMTKDFCNWFRDSGLRRLFREAMVADADALYPVSQGHFLLPEYLRIKVSSEMFPEWGTTNGGAEGVLHLPGAADRDDLSELDVRGLFPCLVCLTKLGVLPELAKVRNKQAALYAAHGELGEIKPRLSQGLLHWFNRFPQIVGAVHG